MQYKITKITKNEKSQESYKVIPENHSRSTSNWTLEVSTYIDLETEIKEGLQMQIFSLFLSITHIFINNNN